MQALERKYCWLPAPRATLTWPSMVQAAPAACAVAEHLPGVPICCVGSAVGASGLQRGQTSAAVPSHSGSVVPLQLLRQYLRVVPWTIGRLWKVPVQQASKSDPLGEPLAA